MNNTQPIKGLFSTLPLTERHNTTFVIGGNKAVLLAHGPLSKQPMTIARRLVLVALDDNTFGVWWQCFPNLNLDDERPNLTQSHFDTGLWNRPTFSEPDEAQRAFARKLLDDSTHLESLLRN